MENKKSKTLLLVGLFIALGEVLLVDAMSGIIGPAIISELGGSQLYAFMYTLSYLCSTLALPFTSMVGQKFGRKKVIILGVLVYGLSTLLAGLVGSMTLHVAARAFQGVGKGCILGNVLAYFGEYLDEADRAKAMGFYGTLTGLIFLLAPVAGGAIGDLVGWRSTFYISVPFSILAFLILLRMPERQLDSGDLPLDWTGTLLLAAITIGIVMMFSWGGQSYPWLSFPVLGMGALFAVSLCLFLLHLKRAAHPIFSPALFQNREFILVVLGVGLMGPTLYAVGTYLPMVNQALAETSSTLSGIIIAVGAAVQLALGYGMGAFIAKTHKIKLVVVTTAVSYIVSNLLMGFCNSAAMLAVLFIGVLFYGYGTTGYSMVYTLHAQNELPKELVGEASSTIQYIQSLCGTIGLSVVGMVLNTSFASGLENSVPEGLTGRLSAETLKGYMGTAILTDKSVREQALSALDTEGQALFTRFIGNIHDAYAAAMNRAFLVLALLSVAALFFAVMLHVTSKAETR